ncbi:hypothetical protein FHR81_005561 [Actinoalloteichus hoggarensis]|uniref:Uncharacterized protein n=1 Tax=Actinoalloteichus hoggarensis TaxID=1470176 RepID=A0A221W4U2_9PSEU|nr:lantibiotic dehydratase C-terminal domain-containing protein [Actinoalloteichus hoggarensis]ASO20671.1 hypothetical protein AHOG_15225 [Actinoalloteichus hoggarensis]MBB5924476.1 hypothetical protein [Actinoalloteichus hoggarensis]
MSEDELVWLSAHVFYHADSDPLLTDLLLPLIRRLRDEGSARRAFFLRHWEQGPHVRVRLQVPLRQAERIRTEFQRSVLGHLAEHPGPADVDPERLGRSLGRLATLETGVSDPAASARILPPNSLHWIDYEPEFAKYGGPKGIAVAEDVFDSSTVVSDHILRGVDSDRARLGVALQLLLLGTRALGLDDDGRAIFLRHYQERWVGYLPDRERLFAAWDEQYRHQESAYRTLADAIADGLDVGRGVGREWERLIHEAVCRVRPLVASGEVWPAEVDRSAPAFVAEAALVCQYTHTTNNRINVRPQGECFVAYLAWRAVLGRLGIDPKQITVGVTGNGVSVDG